MTPELVWLSALVLWGMGVFGLLTTRHVIKVLIALQLLTKGVLLALVGAGVAVGRPQLAQSLALTVIVADTLVAVIGLAVAIRVKHLFGTLDLSALATLKG